jgi:uncharacterized protein
MLKYLLLALAVVWLFYSPALRGRRSTPSRPQPDRAPNRAAPPAIEDMVACAHCGVHLPSGDALRDGHGTPYCSPAHRQAGPSTPRS